MATGSDTTTTACRYLSIKSAHSELVPMINKEQTYETNNQPLGKQYTGPLVASYDALLATTAKSLS